MTHAEPVTLNRFDAMLAASACPPLHGAEIDTIQVNIGLVCNLQCRHCHVASGPKRTERMDWSTMELLLAALERAGASTLDITGGAPEMHSDLPRLIEAARARGVHVIVRTNLTIMLEDGYEHFPEFFARNGVELVASLPCYLEENVDRQRGTGVYHDSVEALQRLNAVGYGRDEALALTLVFNPQGPSLPPAQQALEPDYRQYLREHFGIEFTRLIAITNMPIGRFFGDLRTQKRDREYMDLLERSFNPATIEPLMCRHQVSVDWNGELHDCDFNLALGLGLGEGQPRHIRDFDPRALAKRPICTGDHCLGCTAGAGSSCGGNLA